MRKILRRLKIFARILLGKEIFIRPEIKLPTERAGSDYGGWDIVAANIKPNTVLYSFGVGEDASFDIAMIKKHHLTIHAFDPTPKSIAWVKAQGLPETFVMHEYGLAAVDGNLTFNPPENNEHVSHTLLDRPTTAAKAISVPVKRLSTIMAELGHRHIDILKMDIEGAEYDVIEDMKQSGIKPGQVLVEFHHRFPNVGVEKTRAAIATLRSMGYQLFSVSSSNEEFSFILK